MLVGVTFVLLASGCERRAATPPGFPGVVEYDERRVAFEVAGRVKEVLVHEGDTVDAGAVMARIDDTLERLARDAREEEVKVARAEVAAVSAGPRNEEVLALSSQVRAAEAAEALAKKSAERSRALYETGAVPQADVDRTQAELERIGHERRSLEERLKNLRRGARSQDIARAEARAQATTATVALYDERIARHELRATGGGNVLEVHVESGELVGVGAPVVTLADVDHPYVDAFVPQAELGAMTPGRRAEVRIDGAPEAFAANVEYVSPKTEFTPRYYFSERERPHLVVRVRVRVDDPARRLHAGVPAFVRFLP